MFPRRAGRVTLAYLRSINDESVFMFEFDLRRLFSGSGLLAALSVLVIALPFIPTAALSQSGHTLAEPYRLSQGMGGVAVTPEDARVILLKSTRTGRCGSGFYIDSNTVMTNMHIAESICPVGDCSGVESSDKNNFTVLAEYPALDIALLRAESSRPFGPVLWGEAAREQSAKAIGFPRCGSRAVRSGSVSAIRPLDISLTTEVEHGMSGAPVISEDGRVLGVIREADSLTAALVAMAQGGGFPGRAVRGDLIASVLTQAIPQQCLIQADTLVAQWVRVLDRTTGFERGVSLASIRESALGLLSCTETVSELSSEFLLMLRRPAELSRFGFGVATTPLAWSIQKLALVSSLTAYGPLPIGSVMLPAALEESLLKQVPLERRSEVQEIIAMVNLKGFQGAEHDVLSGLGQWLLVAALIGFIWAFSLGLIFYDLGGGLLRRIFITGIIGLIFWPISLAAYLIFRNQLRKVKPPEEATPIQNNIP